MRCQCDGRISGAYLKVVVWEHDERARRIFTRVFRNEVVAHKLELVEQLTLNEPAIFSLVTLLQLHAVLVSERLVDRVWLVQRLLVEAVGSNELFDSLRLSCFSRDGKSVAAAIKASRQRDLVRRVDLYLRYLRQLDVEEGANVLRLLGDELLEFGLVFRRLKYYTPIRDDEVSMVLAEFFVELLFVLCLDIGLREEQIVMRQRVPKQSTLIGLALVEHFFALD